MKYAVRRYLAICTEDDCFNYVSENDIERGVDGSIYERSKKCWDCRTPQDRRAIKAWRKKQSSKLTHDQK